VSTADFAVCVVLEVVTVGIAAVAAVYGALCAYDRWTERRQR
jgi:hypothetical protein